MRTNRPRRRIQRQTVLALARRLQSLVMNRWLTFFVVAVVCLLVGYRTVWVAERRAIREVDRSFLNKIVRQQSAEADALSAPGRNIGAPSTIALSYPSVLRAELVVHSDIVRRGELVVHSERMKRQRPRIKTIPQNTQASAESGWRLN